MLPIVVLDFYMKPVASSIHHIDGRIAPVPCWPANETGFVIRPFWPDNELYSSFCYSSKMASRTMGSECNKKAVKTYAQWTQ